MQTENKHTGTAGPLKHPESAEWMGFIYGEVTGARRRDLRAHLDQCPACAAQVKAWRASQNDLEEWRVPTRRASMRGGWMPVLRWATAAAAVLAVGMGIGRMISPSAREVAELKASVAQLSQAVRHNSGADNAGAITVATTAANAETMRLLTQYSALQENQRTADQLALKDVLDTFDVRLASLRNELETVAVNTEGGFQATRQNLARLVSFQRAKEQ